MPQCIEDKVRTARKKHYCQFCWEPIDAGEKYKDTTCVDDGTIYSWRMHCCCAKVAELLDMYSKVDEGVDDIAYSDFVQEYVSLFHNINVGEEKEDLDPEWNKPLREVSEMIVKETDEHPELIKYWEEYNDRPWEMVRYEKQSDGSFVKK